MCYWLYHNPGMAFKAHPVYLLTIPKNYDFFENHTIKIYSVYMRDVLQNISKE